MALLVCVPVIAVIKAGWFAVWCMVGLAIFVGMLKLPGLLIGMGLGGR